MTLWPYLHYVAFNVFLQKYTITETKYLMIMIFNWNSFSMLRQSKFIIVSIIENFCQKNLQNLQVVIPKKTNKVFSKN